MLATKITSEYTVYWIHYPSQTDPLSEGYIGVTNNLQRRLIEHKTNRHLRNRMHKGAVCDVLYDKISCNEACSIEYRYRPSENVGWNVAIGGSIPPSRKGKKNKIKRSGDSCTPAQKRSHKQHSIRMKGRLPVNSISVYVFNEKFPSIAAACTKHDITYEQYLYLSNHPNILTKDELMQCISSDKKKAISESRLKSSKVNRGVYYITDPQGVQHIVSSGIVQWCRERNVNSSNLRKSGKTKGYVCEYVNDKNKPNDNNSN